MSTTNPPRNSLVAIERKLITKEEWQKRLNSIKIRKEDMDKLVMDFLVTEGYVETAECFQLESGTEPDIDISAHYRAAVRKIIQSGNLVDAIEEIEDLNPMLLEKEPTLMFILLQQRLIELIRNEKIEEGLEFAQKQLAPIGEKNPYLLPELERTIMLLVFKDLNSGLVRELLDESRLFRVANEVNSVILSSQRLARDPMLESLLKLLMDIQGCLCISASYPQILDFSAAMFEGAWV